MPATVRLQDIAHALEIQLDESSNFLDLDTGEVVCIAHDLLRDAEESDEEPDLPDWQNGHWDVAQKIVSTDRFRKLPTNYDVHEWEVMKDFSNTVESKTIRDELLSAIHGAGAFRYFKDVIRRRGMEQAWYAFREEALREIARDWCEEHHIVWE